MAQITIDIPDELEELKKVPKIQWQMLVQRKLREEFEKIAEFDRIVAKSKLTQEQADALSDEVNWALSRRYQRMYKQKFRGKSKGK